MAGRNVLYWLSFVIAASYLWSTESFYSNYLAHDESSEILETMMIWICVGTMANAIISPLVIFFDVTHFACTIIYGIPLIVVVPSMCLYALINIKLSIETNENTTRRLILDYWKENGEPPIYMSYAEVDQKCCGLDGPTDYRHFVYGDERECQNHVFDVPFSCCNLSALYNHSDPNDFYLDKKCDPITKGNVFYIDPKLVSAHFGGVNLSEDELQQRENKCKYITNNTAVLADTNLSIYSQGCMKTLVEVTRDLLDLHYTFFIIFLFLNCAMLTIFVKHWCTAPELERLALSKNSNQIIVSSEANKSKALMKKT